MTIVKTLLFLMCVWLVFGGLLFVESAVSLPWVSVFCALLVVCVLPRKMIIPLVLGISGWLALWYSLPWWAVFGGVFVAVSVARAIRYTKFVYLGFMSCYVVSMFVMSVVVPHSTSPWWALQAGLIVLLLLLTWRTQLLTRDLSVWYIR